MRHRPARSGAVLELVQPSLLLDLSCTLICARASSGDVHALYRIRDVDALGEFFLQITRSAGTIYRHYMPRQLNLRRVAHMIQMQPGRRLGVSHSSTAANQPDRERACQRREAMSRPRPALLHTCEYNEVCSVEACLCRSLCHTPQRSTCRRPSCRAKCD